MDEMPARSSASRRPASALACAAAVLGALYAAVSAYWGAGGTGLLDTIGGTLEREGRAHTAGLLAVVWATVALKFTASAIGLLAIAQPQWLSPNRCRIVRGAAWMAAVVLVIYGGVLTLTGLLAQADIVHASTHADHKALRWHAVLWDPWFLAWGPLLAAALTLTRRAPTSVGDVGPVSPSHAKT
ncbi:MAG: DUF3995 domain-containing protein [Solirubrobacterales bacterium]|nr:DUF3995 domain-containing protein [Solirubrobacterales bacterium]